MEWKREVKIFFWMLLILLGIYYMPVGTAAFDNAVSESFSLLSWYAHEHMLLCLIPAFFIAGVIAIFISQGLLANGMGKGPALTLLLAGPALSLPNMLVIRSVIGNKKTAAYIILVIIMATISGMIYGSL